MIQKKNNVLVISGGLRRLPTLGYNGTFQLLRLLKLIENSLPFQERLHCVLHVLNNVLRVNSRIQVLLFLIKKKKSKKY